MKAFVAGGTGETGRRVVQQLVERGIPVRAMVRNLATAQSMLPAAADLVMGDVLNRDSLRTAMADCTVVVCATGARPSLDVTGPFLVDYQGTKNLVDVAKEKGITHFVLVSSLCVSNFFHPLNLFWLVLFWKKQAEGYLQQSGLTYTIIRPGGLKSQDADTPIVMAAADRLSEGSIPRSQVAKVCIAALSEPAARNKLVEIIAREDEPARSFAELFGSVS